MSKIHERVRKAQRMRDRTVIYLFMYLFIYLFIYLCMYLCIYLLGTYSPVNRTVSPQGSKERKVGRHI